MSDQNIQDSKDTYFNAECIKCGLEILMKCEWKNEDNYYLCQSCAYAKTDTWL